MAISLRGNCMMQETDLDTGVTFFYVLNPDGGFDNPKPLLTDVTLWYPNGDVVSISSNVVKSEADIKSHLRKNKL